MSKMIFAGLSMVVILILFIVALKSRKDYGRVGRSMAWLLSAGAISMACYSIVFFSEEYQILALGYSLFFASMDWLCLCMLRYAIDYTRHKGKTTLHVKKWFIYCTYAVMMVDSVSLLCNVYFEHAVSFRVIYFQRERYLRATFSPLFYIHLCICYVFLVMSIYLLGKKALGAPVLYRKKYYMVLMILSMLAISDGIFLCIKPAVNLTVFAYSIGALFVYYFSFHYMPNYLEQYMQRLAQDKQQDIIVMFDNEDHCVYMNGNASLFLRDNEKFTKEGFEEAWDYEDEDRKLATLIKDEKKEYYSREYEALFDEDGKYMGCFFVMHDITKERALQEKYRYLATHDELTGLYNREYFFERAEEFMRSRPTEKFLIICSDIRQFKAINDIFGVETGDTVLKVMADALIRDDDGNRIYGRIAGDSFAICIPKSNLTALDRFVKNGNVLYVKNVNYPIVKHVGIYEADDMSISVSAMCDRAMLAIDSIKDDMQKEIVYYDEQLREELLQEKEMVKDLIPAFEEKQFTIYLQPQISHSSGSIVGAETLVRWNHPEKGMIAPNVFIPLMEHNGMISKLDRYVWRMACELLKRYEEQGKEISLSVNISMKDFYYLDLYKEFMSLVKEYHIAPSRLKLEITESAVMQDVPKQIALIKRLQAEGFIIEMDDFGSGYSSLNTLKDIPVDILKLDMKFMEKAEDTERSANILQMVVEMAQKLHMPVIAEGVETKEQADYLGSIGCDIVQGYYYAKPMVVEEFDRLLEEYPYQEIMERA